MHAQYNLYKIVLFTFKRNDFEAFIMTLINV